MDILENSQNQEDSKNQDNQNPANNDNTNKDDKNEANDSSETRSEDQLTAETEYDVNQFRIEENTDQNEDSGESLERVAQKLNFYKKNIDYKIFTSKFDEIAKAENLETLEEILKLRKNLDQQLTSFQDLITKLANRNTR